jgi:hypothetical protein
MTQRPDWEVSAAFGQSPFAALSTLTWTDISADVLGDPALGGGPISFRRGRQSELGTVEAGTLTLTLQNVTRRYDPTNTASIYYPNVRPMTRIRVRVRWPQTSGTWITRWTGYVTAWQPVYPGPRQAVVQVRASDAFTAIARAQSSVTSLGPGELSALAIRSCLTNIGWPSFTDYTFSSQGLTRIAPGAYLNLNALQYMQNITATENGLFFIAGNGFPTFQDRHYRINNATIVGVFGDGGSASSTLNGLHNAAVTTLTLVSAATFPSSGGVVTCGTEQISYTSKNTTQLLGCVRGYHGTTAASHASAAPVTLIELPYQDVAYSFDESLLYNDIQITRAGGALQEAIDSASQTDYGPRVFQESGLYMVTDDEALSLSQWLLGAYSTPNLRVTSLVVKGDLSPATLWPILLDMELSDKIEVLRRPPGGGFLDQYARIEAIADVISLDDWLITCQLSLSGDDLYWVLEDPVQGRIDSVYKIAF